MVNVEGKVPHIVWLGGLQLPEAGPAGEEQEQEEYEGQEEYEEQEQHKLEEWGKAWCTPLAARDLCGSSSSSSCFSSHFSWRWDQYIAGSRFSAPGDVT